MRRGLECSGCGSGIAHDEVNSKSGVYDPGPEAFTGRGNGRDGLGLFVAAADAEVKSSRISRILWLESGKYGSQSNIKKGGIFWGHRKDYGGDGPGAGTKHRIGAAELLRAVEAILRLFGAVFDALRVGGWTQSSKAVFARAGEFQVFGRFEC
ncbi:hypothetical protein C8R44DRAFT_736219 [Mycena epipterygia]|nr:hypothetical protein C8R44DRAFT_736219 [Mycena epipterygia]